MFEVARRPAENSSLVSILYMCIHDQAYPRNRLIREKFASAASCEVYILPFNIGNGFLVEFIRLLHLAIRFKGKCDVIVVSEFSIQWVLPCYLLSRRLGATLVVDRFIGLYETRVEDWRAVGRYSIRAFLYKILDWLAVFLADIVLIDTQVRADNLMSRSRVKRNVLAVPVGAPDWASSDETRIEDDLEGPNGRPLRLLYYGNYIPLHGLPCVVQSVAKANSVVPIEMTFIGNGDSRPEVESLCTTLGVGEICSFVDPVPELDLRDFILNADIVFGVFGNSEKARTVIANKVWQALACGKTVMTLQTAALDELPSSAQSMLRTVRSADPCLLAEVLIRVWKEGMPRSDCADRISYDLSHYVGVRLEDAIGEILGTVRRRRAEDCEGGVR